MFSCSVLGFVCRAEQRDLFARVISKRIKSTPVLIKIMNSLLKPQLVVFHRFLGEWEWERHWM